MKELTEETVCAYLPHQPLVGWHDDGHRCVIDLQMVAKHGVGLANYRMCLRPLSDLTREITHNGETFVPMEKLMKEHPVAYGYYASLDSCQSDSLPYSIMRDLLSWHFDLFDLLSDNLAIDINTISK